MRAAILALLAMSATSAAAPGGGPRFPAQPPAGEHVVDAAALLGEAAHARLRSACRAAEAGAGVAIHIVTLPSLPQWDAAGWSVDRYARALAERWARDRATDGRTALVLVVDAEARLRVLLGGPWDAAVDREAHDLVRTLVLPHFRHGNAEEGLAWAVAGVQALARGAPIPVPPGAPGLPVDLVVVAIGLVLATLGTWSLLRRGRSGVAGVVLTVLAWPLVALMALATIPRHLAYVPRTAAGRRRQPRIQRRAAEIRDRRRLAGEGLLAHLGAGASGSGFRGRFGGNILQTIGTLGGRPSPAGGVRGSW
jgi:uncharacterized membrane protein YgcG